MTSRSQVFRLFAVLALTFALAGAFELLAATSAYAQAGDNYKTATRLGSSSRFDAPLRNAAAVQKWAARKRTQTAIGTVLDKGGLAQLTPTVLDILTKASPDQLKEVDFAVGDTMVWMAFRRGGTKPDIVRNIRWGGKKPFQGFMFVIDDMVQTYTFIVPKPCANLTLVSSEPSREKAKLDAENAAKAEAARVESERIAKERAAAEAARLDAERRERERVEKERVEAARVEAARVEKERIEAETRENERIAAEQLAAEKKAKWDIFVAGLFGKERRTREIDGAAAGSTVLSSLCSPLFGAKVGAEFKVSPNFKIAPAVGFAYNFEESSYSSAFAEVEANYFTTSGKTFVGAGVGVWDFTHSDYAAPSLLVHAGQQIWTNAKEHKLFFVGEGRLFLNGDNGIENNYQFFGGLRFVIR